MSVMESTVAAGEGRNFKLDEFEGPLDMLLFLIKKNEINIYDIPIAKITGQFLEYLRNAQSMDLEETSEFHAMAAMLVLIKSRTLLPVEFDDDGEILDPRQELVDRLIEYQKFKKLSEEMEEKEKDAEWALERKKLQHNLPFSDDDLWENADIWSLMKTFSALIRKIPGERILDMYEEVTVNEKITLLAELLDERGECYFTDLIVRSKSIMDVVCAILAILEAVKTRMIIISQHVMFGDIKIKSREI